MRIVYVNPLGAIGGAERSLLDFLASVRLKDPCLEMHLITGAPGPLVDEAEGLGVRSQVLSMPKQLFELGDAAISLGPSARPGTLCRTAWRALRGGVAARSYARRLRACIQGLAPTLVHSNGIKCHVLTGMMRLPGVPVVWHVHDFLACRRIVSKALRWASRGAVQAIANSRAVEADIRGLLPGLPVQTIYYGIDVNYFVPGPGTGDLLDRLAGLPPAGAEPPRVGLLATYAHWKGQVIFLEAAARLIAASPRAPARFFIIGGPIYGTQGSQYTEAELRAHATRLGVNGHVGFIPFQTDTAATYRALDIVVHASTQPEPFGRTIVEAMACGRAVVAMQAGGAAELFTPEHDALGAPPNDPVGLAAAIRRLIDDPGLRRSLGENARRSAVARFSRPRLGPELLQVYHRLAPCPSPLGVEP